MKKIGVFGGSFDPVHYGHLILAEQMKEEAGLDEVIFVPTYVSPFKTSQITVSGDDRAEMLRLSFAGHPGFSVCDYEIRKEGPSYTVDTLEYLSQEYPDAKLYFIMGTDAFLGIEKWYRKDDLLRNFSYLVGCRKGYDDDGLESFAESIRKKYGTDVRTYRIPELEISSSDLRLRHQAGRSLSFIIPDAVIDYIDSHGLYTGLLEDLEAFAREHQSEKRLRHTMGVVEYAEKYALKFGADPFKAKIAAWFHDNYKSAGNLEHGAVAADEIKKQFGVSDEDILNALRYHTTGRPGMSLLEKVIKLADQLEPSRSFEGAQELRDSVSDDIDEILLKLLESTRDYVLKRGQTYDELSAAAIEYLKNQGNTEVQ